MGLTKQYLAYRAIDSFNIIASGRANLNFAVLEQSEGRFVAAPAAENVIIWDLRMGERKLTLRREKQEVTALRVSPDHLHIAVGYADGVVQIFDLSSRTYYDAICSLALHKNAVSVLRYDAHGMRLVSGGLDTELVVVDVVEQAGRQRLSGHNAAVTDAHFLQRLVEQEVVVSCSKDTQIKLWNLETQFCFKTIVDNRTEIWALAFVNDLMIAGAGESGMNVYRLRKREDASAHATLEAAVQGLAIDDEDTISPLSVSNCGTIQRAGKGRTVNLVADPNERVLSCHGTNDLIENFYICTGEEAKQRLAKRLKKARKKALDAQTASEENDEQLSKELSLSDEIKRLESIKTKQKIKSIDVLLGENKELRMLVSLANNSMTLYSLEASLKSRKSSSSQMDGSIKLLRSLTRLGHQSELRSVCFSNDSLAIGSGAGDSFKFWDRDAMQCLRTVPTQYILCSRFVPGDRYVLLGMKSGKLLIVDVSAADIVEQIPAHESELWSIALLPDQKGCVTGSSDTTLKIWTFELIDSGEEAGQTKVLSLLHKNTLKLEETVLCVAISPNMKYLAVGLLDATVKIFFLDTFKFYLSLYGHKLPVLCMDISYDSTLIATGSADRNIKIWGLNFGDCHRSIFAHDDSVMSLQFIPKTHMFFSCGKDGKVKQWDGDSFEKIITLPGHIGEAHCLSVSPNGRYLVSCGSDRTLRMYERTEETIVLQDVQEEERDQLENEKLATGEDNSVPLLPGLKLPSRKTAGAEQAAESIMECLEISKQFELESDEKPELHPLMLALQVKNPNDFLVTTLVRIRTSDMEESLLLLPFSIVCELLERLPALITQRPDEVELLCRVTVFLFKVHMKPIAAAKSMKPLLLKLLGLLKHDIKQLRDLTGCNLHALSLLQADVEQRQGVQLFRDATLARRKSEKKCRASAKRRIQIQMA
ncbi:WD repeat-containing protein 3 [Drosophila grimshawi]|uniref:GH22400 n=1 Tax=Drosophila grimshawi TaxID=7222 RepID=B4JZ20_DROGR|nr:WD repeat-containing protein 3 [Drosophila grimshawi]EDV98635.1 GH22400 [Drosophila grimshawi]